MNYYEILNLNKNASQDDIKKSFRKLSLKHHPDRGGDENEFKKINEAYENLSDFKKKSTYDNKNAKNFSFVFNRNKFALTIKKTIEITLEQAYSGYLHPFEVIRTITTQNSKITESEKLYISIRAGVNNGEIYILKEKGNIVNNNKGDLRIQIRIKKHHIFTKNRMNLIINKNITLKESLCGYNIVIQHIDGKKYKISFDEIIKPGMSQSIPNLGMIRYDNGNKLSGNLIIIFNINFPSSLSNDQIETLRSIL